MDASLSLLDDYVSEALERVATPYKPAHMRKAERDEEEAEESEYSKWIDCGIVFNRQRFNGVYVCLNDGCFLLQLPPLLLLQR